MAPPSPKMNRLRRRGDLPMGDTPLPPPNGLSPFGTIVCGILLYKIILFLKK